VLVPFDEGAILYRGIADRHIGVEPVLRQHITADMLRQMPRKGDQLGGEIDGAHHHRIVWIEAGLLDLHLGKTVAPASPYGIGKRRSDILGQPERLANIADRAARAIMDDGGDDRGAMAAIAA